MYIKVANVMKLLFIYICTDPEVMKPEYSLRLKISEMIDFLRTRVCKQPIFVLNFESENELKFYNLEASFHVLYISWECYSITE